MSKLPLLPSSEIPEKIYKLPIRRVHLPLASLTILTIFNGKLTAPSVTRVASAVQSPQGAGP